MFFKLKSLRITLLTFIVFLFSFSYLGLEQKTSAWSSIPELENRANQIISSYDDLIFQSIIHKNNNSADVFFSFLESLETENETNKSLFVKATSTDPFINLLHPFLSTLFNIFDNHYNCLNQIIIELNQQQIPLQETAAQPTQNEDSSEQVTGLTLKLTGPYCRTHIPDLKEDFTKNWLSKHPNLDETSSEFKKAWQKEYLKVYKKMTKYKAYHKAYNQAYKQKPEGRANQKNA